MSACPAALIGLSISYALDISGNIYAALVEFASMDNYMTSAERVIAYSHLEPETRHECEADVPDGWPRRGSVAFDKVTSHYYPGGPPILRGRAFHSIID